MGRSAGFRDYNADENLFCDPASKLIGAKSERGQHVGEGFATAWNCGGWPRFLISLASPIPAGAPSFVFYAKGGSRECLLPDDGFPSKMPNIVR